MKNAFEESSKSRGKRRKNHYLSPEGIITWRKGEQSAFTFSGLLGLTGLDLVLQGVLAIDQKLVQVQRLVRDVQVQHFLHLVRVMEIQNLLSSVVALGHVVEQDVDDAVKELSCVLVSLWIVLADRKQT